MSKERRDARSRPNAHDRTYEGGGVGFQRLPVPVGVDPPIRL